MPTNRIVSLLAVATLLPVLAWAQFPGPAATPPVPEAPPTEAEKVLDEAIGKIEALDTIKAEIRQDVSMLGTTFHIEGQYLRGSDHRVYLLLEVQGLGDSAGTMLQVSDGAVLWDYQEALDQPIIRRKELAPILQKLQNPDVDGELREQVLSQLGLAGPDALLSGLRNAAEFNQKEEGELDGKKVWIIRGRWKDRASLSSPDQPPLPPTGPLPPYVPNLVYVWVGQDDGWPYRVELSGRMPGIMEQQKDIRELGPDGRPVGRPMALPDQAPTEIVLRYTNVELNSAIEDREFFWTPPQGVRVIEETEGIVSGLDALLAQREAQRRAEAAQEPTIPGSLSIPSPPTSLPEPSPSDTPGGPPNAP